MKNLQIVFSEGGMLGEEIVGSGTVIQLEGRSAKRYADLKLHDMDMEIAQECVSALLDERNEMRARGLWTAAIMHFMKCFGNSKARGALPDSKIYTEELPRMAFGFFKDLRNKNIAHNENAFNRCVAAAAVHRSGSSEKIREIMCVTLIANTIEHEYMTNLNLLICDARAWIKEQSEQISLIIKEDLEKLSYEELGKYNSIQITGLVNEDVSRSR